MSVGKIDDNYLYSDLVDSIWAVSYTHLGIGGCLLLDGQVFHGFSNSACEVGYLHLPDGAFQDLASTTALVAVSYTHLDVYKRQE